jgi:hypothetical protein
MRDDAVVAEVDRSRLPIEIIEVSEIVSVMIIRVDIKCPKQQTFKGITIKHHTSLAVRHHHSKVAT